MICIYIQCPSLISTMCPSSGGLSSPTTPQSSSHSHSWVLVGRETVPSLLKRDSCRFTATLQIRPVHVKVTSVVGSRAQPIIPPPRRRKTGWRHSPLKQTADSLSSNQSVVQCLCILDRDARLYWLFANVISLYM